MSTCLYAIIGAVDVLLQRAKVIGVVDGILLNVHVYAAGSDVLKWFGAAELR